MDTDREALDWGKEQLRKQAGLVVRKLAEEFGLDHDSVFGIIERRFLNDSPSRTKEIAQTLNLSQRSVLQPILNKFEDEILFKDSAAADTLRIYINFLRLLVKFRTHQKRERKKQRAQSSI